MRFSSPLSIDADIDLDDLFGKPAEAPPTVATETDVAADEPVLDFTTPPPPAAPPPRTLMSDFSGLPNQENITVKDVLTWFKRINPRKSRSAIAAHEMNRLWNMLAEKLGNMRCLDCRPYHLNDIIVGHKRLLSNWTRRRWSTIFQGPFNHAAKLGLVGRNPFKGVSFPGGSDGRDWTDDEYQQLMRAATPEFRRVLVFLRFSGLRPGELRGLKWTNIREDIGAIVIDAENVKTGVKRKVPFNKVTLKLLTWLRRRSVSDFVFVNSFGGAWRMNAICKRLRELREKLGLSPKVRLHGGRHFFATHALMNGLDVAELAELLGHKSIVMTQKYLHLTDKTSHLHAAMAQAIGGKAVAK